MAASKNPFAMLDVDSDDEGTTATKKAPAVVPPATQAASSMRAAPSSAPKKPAAEKKKEEEDLKQPKKGAPGARGGQKGASAVADTIRPAANKPPAGNPNRVEGANGAPRVSHNERHAPGPAGDKHDGYDRRSGTGRPPREVKKGGGGGHNWGKPTDDAAGPAVVAAAGEGEEKKPAAEGEEPAAAEPVPDNTLTFEEYQAQRAAKRQGAAFAEKKVREVKPAVEGKVYVKDADEGEGVYFKTSAASEANGAAKKEAAAATKKEKPTKQMLDVDIKFRESPSGGGDRGDRGDRGFRSERGGRGGGDRGGFRGGRGGSTRGAASPAPAAAAGATAAVGGASRGNIDMKSEAAFPTLGGA